MTVVVVDDDLGVRRALARLLRASGFEVATYASAAAFLGRPADDTGLCLVVDIHLGGMSGLELADCLDAAGTLGSHRVHFGARRVAPCTSRLPQRDDRLPS